VDLSHLNIPLPVKKPVDTSNPYLKSIQAFSQTSGIEANSGTGIVDFINRPKTEALDIIVDTFTGNYWGEKPKEAFINFYDQQIKSYESQIAYLNEKGYVEPVKKYTGNISDFNFTAPPKLSAEEKAKYLSTYNEGINSAKAEREKFNTSYTQRDQMIKSFETYQPNWNRYFEGSYKNPRIAEDNEVAAMRNQNPLTMKPSGAVVNNNSTTRKEIGTGVSSTGNINPFGSLDSGLNI
jgi:hypothetical protein